MHLRIDAHPLGPLRVLSELPDARLAMLEGLNGIGKTLAVRLLQLCAGTMPYRPDSPAWASLCNGLGEFTVTVSELNGANEIVWKADSRPWSDIDPELITSVSVLPFQLITIDGSPRSIDDVRRLLAVHRIAGDEGIIETLAQQADAAADTVARWARRVAAPEHGPLADLEAATQKAFLILGEWTLDRYRELRVMDRNAKRQLEESSRIADSAEARRQELQAATDLRQRLQELRERAPGLEQQLEEVDQRISAIQEEREGLERGVTRLAASVVRAEPAVRELDNARRTLKRNQENLRGALMSASGAALPLKIAAEEAAVSTLITQTEIRVAELMDRQTSLDAAPAMRNLLDQLSGELSGAEDRGLGGQIAVDDPESELELTVSQTRGGMLTRRAFLEGQPPPPESRDVAEELKEAKLTLARARDLWNTLGEAERLEQRVAANERRIDAALTLLQPGAVSELRTLENQRRALDEELLRLAAQRAALHQQLGAVAEGATEPALSAQLQDALQRAGVTLAQLDQAFRDTEEAATTSQQKLRDAQHGVALSRRDVTRAEAEIRRAITTLLESPQWEWLRVAMPNGSALPGEAGTTEQRLEVLDRLRQILDGVLERLGGHREQLGGVESALRGVGRRIRGDDLRTVEYVAELQEWLGNRFSSWFNNPRIRQELLPKATSPITVHLQSRQVGWVEGTKKRSRPLEAFSSGDQAFTYTRARLAVLDDEEPRPPNRLIVLDEFGAFIAHERLNVLLAYLRERAGEHGEDQVLVVLPLGRDYARMAETSVGDEAARLQQLADEVEARSYAVQVQLP
jgi:uncharacterized coiled-coil DUF342 family protein